MTTEYQTEPSNPNAAEIPQQAYQAPTSPAQPASVGYPAPQHSAEQAAPVPVEEPGQPVVSNDVDALAPEPGRYTMESGQEIIISRIKTRELFKFLKILTKGGGPLLSELNFSSGMDTDEFTQLLLVLAVSSIPNAEEETMEFLQFIVQPQKLIIPERSKDDRQKNEDEWRSLAEQLANPEIIDTIGIISAMVRQEAEDIQSLGKKIRALLPASLISTQN